MTSRSFGRYTVEVTRQEKVLFPDAGYTKGDVIRHYERVSPWLLPHIRNRVLTLQRFPDGIQEKGFYQKAAPAHFPKWLDRAEVRLADGGTQNQVVARNRATLVYLANQGVITLHTALARREHPKQADRMVFDLDPPEDDFRLVRATAQALREILEGVGLTPFFMTTGSTGGHVWVPLLRGSSFSEIRGFAAEVTEFLAGRQVETLTTAVRKEKRRGRLFLDVGRNAPGQTAVAPYSLRPKKGAPMAMPLEWGSLDDPKLHARSFGLADLDGRMASAGDPWRGMGRSAASLPRAHKEWRRMRKEDSDA